MASRHGSRTFLVPSCYQMTFEIFLQLADPGPHSIFFGRESRVLTSQDRRVRVLNNYCYEYHVRNCLHSTVNVRAMVDTFNRRRRNRRSAN